MPDMRCFEHGDIFDFNSQLIWDEDAKISPYKTYLVQQGASADELFDDDFYNSYKAEYDMFVSSRKNDEDEWSPSWYHVAQDRHFYQKMRTTRKWTRNTSEKYRRRDGSVSMRGNRWWYWEDRADRARRMKLKYAHVD